MKMSYQDIISLNNLFPYLDQQDQPNWSPKSSAAFDITLLAEIGLWIVSTQDRIRDRSDFRSFLALLKLIEAIALYETLIPTYSQIIYLGYPNYAKSIIDAGIFDFTTANLVEKKQLEIEQTAETIYPNIYEEIRTIQDSWYRNFVADIHNVAVSHELHIPLISAVHSDVSTILIGRELAARPTINALNLVYTNALKEIYEGIEQICRAQGSEGILVPPVAFRWLKRVNKKSVTRIDTMIEIALDIREEMQKTREYFKELSYALCDVSGSFRSYQKTQKRITQLQKLLVDLADPDGERLFLLRLADIRQIAPSLQELIASSSSATLINQLKDKQLNWWGRRILFRRAYHLFSFFDNFLNSRAVCQEVARFFRCEIPKEEIEWARNRDEELKHNSQLRLIKDIKVSAPHRKQKRKPVGGNKAT